MFFIYQYHDPRNWDLVYIGLTDNLERRMKQHLFRSDSPVYPLAKELRELGLQLHSSILDSNSDLEVARGLEAKYIKEKKPILNTAHNVTSDVDQVKRVAAVADDIVSVECPDQDDDEDDAVERRKRGKQAFEKTHDRWTLWVRKKQKRAIKQLAKEQEVSYVALLEEAIDLLLKKYGK